jgi:hypothetical protein
VLVYLKHTFLPLLPVYGIYVLRSYFYPEKLPKIRK